MIAKLTGIVDSISRDHAIIDVNGVGYLVRCSTRTLGAMPPGGGAVSLAIETIVREDAIDLYGFGAGSERDWFRLLTTVQDLGRWGHQNQGVPVAGPMDPFAHRAANAMVGNGPDAATLEVTLVGPAVTCSDTRRVAVAGAAFEISVERQPVDPAEAITLPAGATLRFTRRVAGARAYLAIDGGVDVPRVLGDEQAVLQVCLHAQPLQCGAEDAHVRLPDADVRRERHALFDRLEVTPQSEALQQR